MVVFASYWITRGQPQCLLSIPNLLAGCFNVQILFPSEQYFSLHLPWQRVGRLVFLDLYPVYVGYFVPSFCCWLVAAECTAKALMVIAFDVGWGKKVCCNNSKTLAEWLWCQKLQHWEDPFATIWSGFWGLEDIRCYYYRMQLGVWKILIPIVLGLL